jgi:hypothetical protein
MYPWAVQKENGGEMETVVRAERALEEMDRISVRLRTELVKVDEERMRMQALVKEHKKRLAQAVCAESWRCKARQICR